MKKYIKPHIIVVSIQMQHRLLAGSVYKDENATQGEEGGGNGDESGGDGLARRTIRQPNVWQEW